MKNDNPDLEIAIAPTSTKFVKFCT